MKIVHFFPVDVENYLRKLRVFSLEVDFFNENLRYLSFTVQEKCFNFRIFESWEWGRGGGDNQLKLWGIVFTRRQLPELPTITYYEIS